MTKKPKKLKAPRVSLKVSLKYRGIQPSTKKRYEAQLKAFFLFLKGNELELATSWRDLDLQVAEYVDHMFQDDVPIGYAGDLLSGLSRWLPGSRIKLPTARLWFRNWSREVIRRRALPLPMHILKGLAGIALAARRLDLAVLLPLGFLCMLRTAELYGLTKADVTFNPSGKTAIIALRRTRTSGPNTEEGVLHDPLVVKALKTLCDTLQPGETLYARKARFFWEDLRWLAKFIGFSHNRFSPYSLRRGGATWHMHAYGSLALTALIGRWKHERTAKIYIDGAAAEWASWQLTEKGEQLVKKGANVFNGSFK